MKTAQVDWRYRLTIASRTLAAAAGGYAVAAGFAAALSLALAQAMPRVDAVLTATMLAWLAYAAAVAWVFYARTSWGAWLGTLAPAAVMGAVAMAPRWLGAAA
ncbi:hypothetical protein CLU88_1815 [Acidovorax sp. 56]|uniref:DUF3649 domain-containing protein n=1 Tax=Acidovorax sp. 56 TaxID=2035205 RepID=UPI000C1689F3|nr:DUF3649 domain-containing protein [Acidovorax sp. 56]PIF26932.1 hypothetical protein CLU88_1815 [Acidovorax sp. 56]